MTRNSPRLNKPFFLALAALLLIPIAPLAAQEDKPDADPKLEKYFLANGAYNRKLYPVAVTQYESFLKEHADHPKADLARRGLALSLYSLKQYEKASPHLVKLLANPKLDPTISRERLIMLQGQCLMMTGKKDAAKTLFVAEVKNLKEDAYRAGALAAICDVSFGKAAWQDVLTWGDQLQAANPSAEQAARGHYQQGYAHYQLKKPVEAIAALTKIDGLKANKTWKTRADYLKGECYNLQKDYAKAEAAFVGALPGLVGKDALECNYRLGLTRFVLKKYNESAADLGKLLATAPENNPKISNAKLYTARCQLELGDFEKAAEGFSELSKGEGDNAARASHWLARVHTRQGQDYEKAAAVLGKAVEQFKDSPVTDDLQFDYANALMASSTPQWEKALGYLLAIEERGKFAQMAEVISQRAVCQHKLGDYAGSLGSNEAFLAKFADHTLAADARFMKAENLFLLDRLDDAAKAYAEFTATHKDHASVAAASFRQAQVYHDKGEWEKCLAVAAPMLAQKPEGRLYAQLPFIVGDCLFRQEKWAEAINGLGDFLTSRLKTAEGKAEPNVDTALMQLAVAHDRIDKKEQALKNLAVLVSLPGESAQLPLALVEQGRLAFETGDLDLARKALERFVAEDAKDSETFQKGAPAQRPRAKYYLGWVDARAGKHKEAASNFADVSKIADHALAPDAALQQGIALVSAENFEAASKHFTEVLNRYPKHAKLPRLVYYTGLSLARLEKWEQAKGQFKRVAEAFGDSEFADQALYEWAWCERRLKRNAEATKLYEKLLKSHEGSPLAIKVQSELAELQLESGDQDKVIAQLTATLEKVKEPALREDIRYQLASAHYSKDDHKTAAAQFEQLIKDYPESKLMASMLFQAGESQLKLGGTVAARDHFAKASGAANIPKGLAESIAMRLAETQALTKDYAKAQASYAAFLEKFPESRWTRNAQFGVAFALENSGETEKAIPEYRKLLADNKIDLWTVRSRFQLGECLFDLQKYDDAVTEFVNVEVNYGKYPSWQAKAVLEMARVLIAQGKKEQGAEQLKHVINKYSKEKAAVVAQQYLDELRSQ